MIAEYLPLTHSLGTHSIRDAWEVPEETPKRANLASHPMLNPDGPDPRLLKPQTGLMGQGGGASAGSQLCCPAGSSNRGIQVR